MSFVRALNFETPVRSGEAKQDKVEIRIEGGEVRGDAGEVAIFLSVLGSPSRLERGENEIEPYGRLFVRPRRQEPPFADQRIRARPLLVGNRRYPPPLMGGWIEIKRRGDTVWTIEAMLSLNPTRFARHQCRPDSARQILENLGHVNAEIFEREVADQFEGEFALAGRDNWIPAEFRWAFFTMNRWWQVHLRNCVTESLQAVIRDLERAAEIAPVEIAHQWRFNVCSVETYWEFLSSDPIGTVLALQPLLETFASRSVIARDYQCRPETIENSRCLRLETRVGEVVKIYAKTNRRIRFEVMHRLRGGRCFRINGGHTFDSEEQVIRLIEDLAAESRSKINELLTHFRMHRSVPAIQHTVLAFISNVQNACGDPDKALEVLKLLVNNKSLVVGNGIPLGPALRAELRSMVRAGILKVSNRRYSVTPSYNQALQRMRQTGVAFPLESTIRRRRRS